MIITQTPFRMSFFGGGTDMENFFKEHGGAVLSTTFDKYCYVNVRHLPRFFDYSTELSYSKTERVTDINDIQHPAIRNAMKMLDILGNQFLKFGKFGSDIVVDFYVFVQRTLPDINSNRIACLFSRNGNRSILCICKTYHYVICSFYLLALFSSAHR